MSSDLLAAYDSQVRTALSNREPAGVLIDWDGPLLRATGMHRGFVNYRNLAGLTGAALAELIERTCRYFGERGESFEWKTHSHDGPPELTELLRSAGFVAEELERVMIGAAAELATEPVLPDGVALRQVSELADFRRITAMSNQVWDEDWSWLADDLAARQAADPANQQVYVAEADGEVVSAAWLVRNPGTDFAGLWGGSTLPRWRGRGIYRALVACRAQRAVRDGVRYLQVDASADSAPILRRLGFVQVTTTTPYVWTPQR